ncbi:MAG TPA: YtcA family lipoprotein [Stellaceae bacterium]|nr:YtcA family lipoprotein [Stellaceae bacterium]
MASCRSAGAPSLVLFGAYFPAWMLCATVGVVIAAAARVAMVATGLSTTLPFQLFVCLSVGVIAAVLTWFVLFG